MPLDHSRPASQDSSAVHWDLTGDINVPEDKPGFAETLGASWRLKNTFGAYGASRVQQIGGAALRRVDTDFNPFQLGLLDDYEDNPEDLDRLLKAHNSVAFEAIKADIDRGKAGPENSGGVRLERRNGYRRGHCGLADFIARGRLCSGRQGRLQRIAFGRVDGDRSHGRDGRTRGRPLYASTDA